MLEGKNYRITKENIFAHELIGLKAKVVGGSEKSRIGLKGYIMDETRNVLVLETAAGMKTVPKSESVFEFDLGKERAVVEGRKIVARPEDRIKLFGRKRS